jgi:hypothetical protein
MERWQRLVNDALERRTLDHLIPLIVDMVLFSLGDALDQNLLELHWEKADGTCVSLEQLGGGEIGGWLTPGPYGWIQRFSSERQVDVLEGLGYNSDGCSSN